MTRPAVDSGQIGAPFSARLTWNKDSVAVALAGELDLNAAGQVNNVAREILLRPVRVVRVDLTHLTFCDCAGARALSSLGQQLARHDRQVQADGMQDVVRHVCELMGVALP